MANEKKHGAAINMYTVAFRIKDNKYLSTDFAALCENLLLNGSYFRKRGCFCIHSPFIIHFACVFVKNKDHGYRLQ